MKSGITNIRRRISNNLSRNGRTFLTAALVIAGLCGLRAQNVTTLAEMSSAEIITLLDNSRVISKLSPKVSREVTVDVTAEDLISKVYGVIDNSMTRNQMLADTFNQISMMPSSEVTGLWLDSSEGFNINYSGMCPEVSAMARFNGEELTDYGYFFLFPYNCSEKENANADQCRFCGSLLQELSDMGDDWGVNQLSGDLFEVIGEHDGNYVAIRLIDDAGNGESGGRFIVLMSVEPVGFTSSDNLAAL